MAEKDADAVERQCSALQEDELTVLEVSSLELDTPRGLYQTC
jgi:hypothetical protein